MNGLQDIGNGWLTADTSFIVPFSGSRLQGFFNYKGIKNISLWGVGSIGSLNIHLKGKNEQISAFTEYRTSPNLLELRNEEVTLELSAFLNEPILMVYQEIRKNNFKYSISFAPSKNNLWKTESQGLIRSSYIFAESTRVSTIHDEFTIYYENREYKTQNKTIFIYIFSIGFEQETKRAIEKLKAHINIFTELNSLKLQNIPINIYKHIFDQYGLLEKSYITQAVHCLHAAFSCIKKDDTEKFAGIAAGIGYSVPARSYYRDSYWTCLALLPFTPNIVKQQILYLEKGIYEDGEAPSGLIYPTEIGLKYWEERKKKDTLLARDHIKPLDWWSDHFDSPLFFINLVFDYIDITNDWAILYEGTDRSIKEKIHIILRRYKALEDEDGIPIKPLHDRDWADNVFRQGAVTYDVALYYGALTKAAKLDDAFSDRAQKLRMAASKRLWLADKGYFAEFVQSNGYAESHLAIEIITAIHFGLATEKESNTILKAIKKNLFTKNNNEQPFGDWGIMSVFPGYSAQTKRRGKSLFQYRYHNGADWPYWDGLLAWILVKRKDFDYRYALTRWWEYGLAQAWPEPVEYYSPPFGRGSSLQAWSSLSLRAIYEAHKQNLL